MKKTFSTLLLICILPFRQFKKIFKDNFLSGLILGAIFSLLVNIVSMQLQGMIEKQRILEAIENEINTNNLQASGFVTTALTQREKKIKANSMMLARKFSRDVWEQSSEPLQYVAQLDQKNQILINTYYSIVLPDSNHMIERMNSEYDLRMKDCFDYSNIRTTNEQLECDNQYYFYLDSIALYPGNHVHKSGTELLKTFHPTKDRLNSQLLKFLMGSESMRILSGK